MLAIRSAVPIRWGTLDLPLFGLTKDWHGNRLDPPLAWSLALDPDRLWFVASHRLPAVLHPKARPRQFLAELWRYDVAELFLANPRNGRYLEVNLAANGAWWSCEFTAPRQRVHPEAQAFPGVETHADLAPDGTWLAAISLPLDELRQRLDFGKATKANATFIISSPDQRFLTVTDLGDGEPDFHRPERFATLLIRDGGLPDRADGP